MLAFPWMNQHASLQKEELDKFCRNLHQIIKRRSHTAVSLPNSQTAECGCAHYMGTVISNCINVIWVECLTSSPRVTLGWWPAGNRVLTSPVLLGKPGNKAEVAGPRPPKVDWFNIIKAHQLHIKAVQAREALDWWNVYKEIALLFIITPNEKSVSDGICRFLAILDRVLKAIRTAIFESLRINNRKKIRVIFSVSWHHI